MAAKGALESTRESTIASIPERPGAEEASSSAPPAPRLVTAVSAVNAAVRMAAANRRASLHKSGDLGAALAALDAARNDEGAPEDDAGGKGRPPAQPSAEDDDDDDVREDLNPEVGLPPIADVALTPEDLEASVRPLAKQESRQAMKAAVLAIKEENGGGGEGTSAMLSQLMAELEALKQENMSLKVKVGGELDQSQDEALLQAYLSHLKDILVMRQSGKFDQATFDAYNGAMVQLSDEHIREMYQCFMLVYVDEAEDETYERL